MKPFLLMCCITYDKNSIVFGRKLSIRYSFLVNISVIYKIKIFYDSLNYTPEILDLNCNSFFYHELKFRIFGFCCNQNNVWYIYNVLVLPVSIIILE